MFVDTYMKPPDDDGLQLEIVAGEAGYCSTQVTRLKHSRLLITANLHNSQRHLETVRDNFRDI